MCRSRVILQPGDASGLDRSGADQPFATAATTVARVIGSSHRRRLATIERPLSATSADVSRRLCFQAFWCAAKENNRPTRVVTVASRTEYMAIAPGGAGVSRLPRSSTLRGRL